MIRKKLHHVALRCKDAGETARFYTEVLAMKLAAAPSLDRVPSTGEFSPHLNVFLEMEDGSLLDFIDVPLSPEAMKDTNTPAWVQHLALDVGSEEALLEVKRRVQAWGGHVIGPVDHGFRMSIYFFEPSGHRLEMVWNHNLPQLAEMTLTAEADLARWQAKKKAGWEIPADAKKAVA